MRPIIRDDLMLVIRKVIVAIERNDLIELAQLSNHTIHDASIFQEDDPLTLAVLVYALSKVIERCKEKAHSCPLVVPQLKVALQALERDDENAYRSVMKQVLVEIGSYDQKLKMYIQEVVEKAKIKKGSKVHEHGISIARSAELLGLSQWELQGYIGKGMGESPATLVVEERLRRTRVLFGVPK